MTFPRRLRLARSLAEPPVAFNRVKAYWDDNRNMSWYAKGGLLVSLKTLVGADGVERWIDRADRAL